MRRALTLLVLLSATPAPVRADDLATAQRRVFEATRRFQAGDFQAALAALEQADRIVAPLHDPSLAAIRFNIARCLEEMDRAPEALAAYERYSKLPDDPHRKQRAWRAIQVLEARVLGALSVRCDATGATVRVPGLTQAPEPCPWSRTRVPPGDYTVQVRRPGSAPVDRSARLEAGRTTDVEIHLVALPPDPARAAPLWVPEMPAPAPPVDPWPWAAVATGAALVGGGVGLSVWAAGARDEAEGLPPSGRRDEQVSRFELRRDLAYTSYALGAVAVAGAVALFLGGPDEAAPQTGLRLTGPAQVQLRF